MYEMFFRSLPSDEARIDARHDTPADGLLTTDTVFTSYAYVERSHFDDRQGTNEAEFMERAIRSTAIGADKVWYVTPWKMAESFARMASLNRNLHLSVLRQQRAFYERFTRLSDGYLRARPEQLKGMSDVVSQVHGATGSAVGRVLSVQHAAGQASNHLTDDAGNTYYIYAKTGTIGEGEHSNRHRFGVIITNRDLTQATEEELMQTRYVVCYFAFAHSGYQNIYGQAIDQVIQSTEFKQYMNQQEQ